MTEIPLHDLVSTLRSKNAGVDRITLDVIFTDRTVYEYVRDNQLVTKALVAEQYGINRARISDFVFFDPAKALKITIKRTRPSGNPGEHDVYGAQQYAPLYDLEIPLPDRLLPS